MREPPLFFGYVECLLWICGVSCILVDLMIWIKPGPNAHLLFWVRVIVFAAVLVHTKKFSKSFLAATFLLCWFFACALAEIVKSLYVAAQNSYEFWRELFWPAAQAQERRERKQKCEEEKREIIKLKLLRRAEVYEKKAAKLRAQIQERRDNL